MKRDPSIYKNALATLEHFNEDHITLNQCRVSFVDLALLAAENEVETTHLLREVLNRFKLYKIEDESTHYHLSKNSSGSVAGIFEPEEEYKYKTPFADHILKTFRELGIQGIIDWDCPSTQTRKDLIQWEKDFPDIAQAIATFQETAQDIIAFLNNYADDNGEPSPIYPQPLPDPPEEVHINMELPKAEEVLETFKTITDSFKPQIPDNYTGGIDPIPGNDFPMPDIDNPEHIWMLRELTLELITQGNLERIKACWKLPPDTLTEDTRRLFMIFKLMGIDYIDIDHIPNEWANYLSKDHLVYDID